LIISIFLVTLLTIFATTLSTITGFGTTTITLPIMLFFFPIHETILFIAIIHWFENIWRLILFRKGANWKLILSFGIPALFAGAIGARASIHMPEEILTRILGIFLFGYSAFIILKPKFKRRKTTQNSIVGGIFSGFFAGIIGLGGAIRSAFLTAFDLPKIVYLFSTNAISLLIDTVRLPIYGLNGTKLPTSFAWAAIAFIPLSLVAAIYAKKLVVKIPQKYFRLVITIFLGLAGLKFLLCP